MELCSSLIIFAFVSTWPWTMCPSRALFRVNEPSRFTRFPFFRESRLVFFRVSGIAAKVKLVFCFLVIVQQAPLTVMESPIFLPFRIFFVEITKFLLPFSVLIVSTFPISSMIPVNI